MQYLNSVQCQLYDCTLFRSQSFGLLSSHVLLQDGSNKGHHTTVTVSQMLLISEKKTLTLSVFVLPFFITLSLDSWPSSLAALKIIWVPCCGETDGRVRTIWRGEQSGVWEVSEWRGEFSETDSCRYKKLFAEWGGERVLSSFIYASMKHSQLTSVVLGDREGSGALVYRQSVLQGLMGR